MQKRDILMLYALLFIAFSVMWYVNADVGGVFAHAGGASFGWFLHKWYAGEQ